eukprot:Skav218487  [mRNA]  locus=scaffold538:1243807:1249974:- [translate_table: standard]
MQWMVANRIHGSRHLGVETTYSKAAFDFIPSPGRHWVRWRGNFILVDRARETKTVDMSTGAPWETLTLTALSFKPNVFHEILAEAKEVSSVGCSSDRRFMLIFKTFCRAINGAPTGWAPATLREVPSLELVFGGFSLNAQQLDLVLRWLLAPKSLVQQALEAQALQEPEPQLRCWADFRGSGLEDEGLAKLLKCLASMPLVVERLYLQDNSITQRHKPRAEASWNMLKSLIQRIDMIRP